MEAPGESLGLCSQQVAWERSRSDANDCSFATVACWQVAGQHSVTHLLAGGRLSRSSLAGSDVQPLAHSLRSSQRTDEFAQSLHHRTGPSRYEARSAELPSAGWSCNWTIEANCQSLMSRGHSIVTAWARTQNRWCLVTQVCCPGCQNPGCQNPGRPLQVLVLAPLQVLVAVAGSMELAAGGCRSGRCQSVGRRCFQPARKLKGWMWESAQRCFPRHPLLCH